MENSANENIKNKGWHIFENVVDEKLLNELGKDLEESYAIRRPIQEKNGVADDMTGNSHHLLADGKSFFEYISRLYIDAELKEYFGGNYILNTFGGNLNLRSQVTYASRVHRDVRTYTSDIRLLLNILIVVDDFTLDNGATYLLSGSHLKIDKPTDEFFYANADRAVAKRGSIIVWDANVWHAAGSNNTDGRRRGLSLIYSKPFMKQQFDYCRNIGYDKVAAMPENIQQVLGYKSRTPQTLEEWYQKPANRFYRPDQE